MHECSKENFLGQVKEFMQNTKGTKALQWTMAGVVIVQIGAFLVMWGGLTETVKKNTDQVWNRNTPAITDNTRNIDKILAKLDARLAYADGRVKDIPKVVK